MGTTALYLLIGSLAGQAASADKEWPLAVQLERGSELVYRGHYSEETGDGQVRFSRSYRLENRLFVMESVASELQAAIMTIWKSRQTASEATADLNSVRMELVRANPRGQLRSEAKRSLAAPLDGPPTIECGAFLALPAKPVGLQQPWTETEAGQPMRIWTIDRVETVGGHRCLKVVGVQESEEWSKPRADRAAWRRNDTVWLNPRTGCAQQVERVVERREPARREPSHKTILRYELESSLQYPGQLFEDRRREVMQAHSLYETVTAYLPRAGQVGPRPFDVVLERLKYYQDRYPPTPYRQALVQVKRLAEAGKRGESPPLLPVEPIQPVAHVIAAGRPAPDFLAHDFVTLDSTRLKNWLGRPIAMIFYNPHASSVDQVLRFAQRLDSQLGERVHVLTLAVSDDAQTILDQRERLKLYVPVLSGKGLRLSYAVEATPKLVVLDAAGIVRSSYLGWGPETPAAVLDDLQDCLRQE